MLVGALDFVQRDVPEILIDRWPEHDPKQVTVKVNGQQRSFSIERVDAPWSLRTKLQEIFQVRAAEPAAGARTRKSRGGWSRSRWPRPTACSTRSIRTRCCSTSRPTRTCARRPRASSAASGIVIEMDKKNRITVKRPMPETPAIRVGIKAKDHIVRINNESTVNMTLERGGRAAARRRRHQRRRLHRARHRARA